MRYPDLTGQTFGRLHALEFSHTSESGHKYYKCECNCEPNKIVFIRADRLIYGETTSCGCYAKIACVTHGCYDHPLYSVWGGMKRRCLDSNYDNYHNYGGRGITVCDEWMNEPNAFIEWGDSHGYAKGLQLDRIDTNGNYCPENCRFVTPKENSRNKRDNHHVTIYGHTMLLVEWCELTGIPSGTLSGRVYAGLTDDELLLPSNGIPYNSRCIYMNDIWVPIEVVSEMYNIPERILRARMADNCSYEHLFLPYIK